ncbi:MAG: glycosyltransferase, partial [Flavobacteriales bacterium]
MKVVIATDGVYPLAMGGMQRHSRLLAEHLASSGKVQLTVLHPHPPGIFDPALGITEVHIEPIDTDRFYLRELWRYSERVGRKLEELQPDVILSQGFCVWKGIGRFSDRLIVHPHGLEMFQGLSRKEQWLGAPFRWAWKYIVRRSRAVISLGGKLTGILQGLAQGSACQVVVIPNAVDVPARPIPKPRSPEAPITLLFVGRFAFNKGIDVLMQVAQRFVAEGKSDKFRFDLAGDGP